MRALNPREKKLFLAIIVVCGVSGTLWFEKNLQSRVRDIENELAVIQDKINKMVTRSVARTAAPGSANQVSTRWMEEITGTRHVQWLRVVRFDRTAENSFKIILEGKFTDLARFLGYLEREKSRFQVVSSELERIAGRVEPERAIRGTLFLSAKGDTRS